MKLSSCLVLIASLAPVLAARAEQPPPQKPPALKVGDTIMFVAPAGETNMDAVRLAKCRLEQLGFRVLLPDSLGRQRGYLAGSDAQRATELMAAFAHPDVDAVFPVTGGYGTTRILDRLDYELIATHPKIMIGFSDITGLHLALAAKCNLVTFHSPNPEYGLGSEEGLKEFHACYFWRSILAKENRGQPGFSYRPPHADFKIVSVRPGIARGRTTGGNLSLIAALMGTPYEVETNGRIVLLEDTREAPYRIDRMLSQLRLAGKLDSPAAVILGAFHRCTAEDEASLTLDEVIADYFAAAPYPVIKNFPAGHGPWNATLPLGVLAEVDGNGGAVRLLENPVSLPASNE